MKNTHIAGCAKYSYVKCAFVALLKKRTGYSIRLYSTTSKPKSQVNNCLKRKITHASRILSFGIRVIIPIPSSTQADNSIINSSGIKLFPSLPFNNFQTFILLKSLKYNSIFILLQIFHICIFQLQTNQNIYEYPRSYC